MKFKGVRIDIEKAKILKQELTNKEQEILLKVKQETGIEPQIWAARSIATVFDKLGLPYERTEKSLAPSFTKNFYKNTNTL
jgi:propanediol dehydratase large subunit